jgi:hypothetical protein
MNELYKRALIIVDLDLSAFNTKAFKAFESL